MMDNIFLTENMKLWISSMFDDEIENSRVAASNEHLWALGSNNGDSAFQHEMNAEENREYVEVLKKLKHIIINESGEKQ